MSEIADMGDWNSKDNNILDQALQERPHHLPRSQTVKFAIFRGSWATISLDDLKEPTLAAVFRGYRNEPQLKQKVREECSQVDLDAIATTLPLFVGDHYMEAGHFAEAAKLFLRGMDEQSAVKATEKVIDQVGNREIDSSNLPTIVESWKNSGVRGKLGSNRVRDLLSLFETPGQIAERSAERVMHSFGADIVKLAVQASGLDMSLLHSFDRNAFEREVEIALIGLFEKDPVKVVAWYQERKDLVHALGFAENNLELLSNDELVQSIVGRFSLRSQRLKEEIEKRKLILNTVGICLQQDNWDLKFAEELSNTALETVEVARENATELHKAWEPVVEDSRVRDMISRVGESKIRIFLRLFFLNPRETGKNKKFGKKCITHLGKDIVKTAVEKWSKKLRYTGGLYSVLRLFDKTEFESLRPPPPPPPTIWNVNDRVLVSGLQSEKGSLLNGVSDVICFVPFQMAMHTLNTPPPFIEPLKSEARHHNRSKKRRLAVWRASGWCRGAQIDP
jgi:hypothetical protein